MNHYAEWIAQQHAQGLRVIFIRDKFARVPPSDNVAEAIGVKAKARFPRCAFWIENCTFQPGESWGEWIRIVDEACAPLGFKPTLEN